MSVDIKTKWSDIIKSLNNKSLREKIVSKIQMSATLIRRENENNIWN